MGSFTDYSENAILKHLSRETAYTPVATVYLALATSSPGETATGASMNECANSNNYARTAITFGAASSRRVTQSGTVTFPTASGSWGTVTHWAVVDSATHGAGNVLAYGAFATSKSIVNGNTPSVSSAEIYVEITASTGLSNYAANGFLDRMFRNQAFTISANAVALYTVAPTDSTSGTEVTNAGSYARVTVNIQGGASPAWSAVSAGSLANANTVTFTAATGSWGTVVAAAIADSATHGAGNILWYNTVTNQAVASGDTVQFAATTGLTLSQT